MPATTATDAPGVDAAQRRILLVLSAGQILAGVGMGAAFSLGALLAAAIAHTDALAGLASTMTTLGAAACSIPLARLAGRLGRRRALAAGAVLAAAGGVVVLVAASLGSFPLLLVGFAALGSGGAVNLQTRFAAVDLAPAHRRGRHLSLVIWATTVGIVLGPNIAPPGEAMGRALGLPPLTGAFAITVACQLLASALYLLALRPDPLLTARAREAERAPGTGAVHPRRGAALRVFRENRVAAVAVLSVALSHAIMVGIMAMAPVHLTGGGATIAIVGFTLSIHTAGMYALSPVFGWLSDRVGRVATLLVGQAVFVAALLLNSAGGDGEVAVMAALGLLGLGWSASTVAGSALLTDALTVDERPAVQGFSDTLMNLCGAGGGALAGLGYAAVGYGVLNLATLVVVAVTVTALVVAGRGSRPSASPA